MLLRQPGHLGDALVASPIAVPEKLREVLPVAGVVTGAEDGYGTAWPTRPRRDACFCTRPSLHQGWRTAQTRAAAPNQNRQRDRDHASYHKGFGAPWSRTSIPDGWLQGGAARRPDPMSVARRCPGDPQALHPAGPDWPTLSCSGCGRWGDDGRGGRLLVEQPARQGLVEDARIARMRQCSLGRSRRRYARPR